MSRDGFYTFTETLSANVACLDGRRSGFHQGRGFRLLSRGGRGSPGCLRWGFTEISQKHRSGSCADLHRYQKEAQVRAAGTAGAEPN